ncbi:hypothetical protein NLG97_g6587 [Lecanicillium saksenae]|uniref:Uncharacterized protein n=1 Tax=Lecanicillium saksenae TaxID=468837 RepID=A0ACC1QQI7_9HYPO|nr:hypothetical protein NLG97_g6587 [Lecanicillium saksenae]
MVAYSALQASNALISRALPENLVAVFVGGTSGIGEYTLKELISHVRKPRIYILGRSQSSFDRIAAESREINPEGQYTFVQGDLSLLRNVDGLCKQVQDKEKAINMLFWSAGTLIAGQKTDEGLDFAATLKHYSRTRIISNFLPQLEAAQGIRRVVSVATATSEGHIDWDDFQLLNGGGMKKRQAHNSAIITLTNEYFAEKAPTVTFVQDFPGSVKSGIGRGTSGILGFAFAIANVLGPLLFFKPEKESGERHLYYLTSARYKARQGAAEESVPLGEGVTVARGIDGVPGSGVYSCDSENDEAPEEVEKAVIEHKKQGVVERVWKQIQKDTDAVLKSVSK